MIKKQEKNFWDGIHLEEWQKISSPWRPSESDIKNYEIGINLLGRNPEKILILGATPELRNIAAKLKSKVWLVDYSKKMIVGMTKFLKAAKPRNEKWIIDDWRRCRGLGKDFFDIVLGDLVYRLIPFKQEKIFFSKIKSLLKPSGLFVARFHFVNEALRKQPANKIIKETLSFSDPLIQGRGRYVSNLLVVRLIDKYAELRKREKIKRAVFKEIDEFLKRGDDITSNQRNILIGVLNRLAGQREVQFFLRNRWDAEKQLIKFFVIKQKLTANDYEDGKYFPIYVLKSKA